MSTTRPRSLRWPQRVVSWAVRAIVRIKLHRHHPVVSGLENIPKEGGVLFVANHPHRIVGPILWSVLPLGTVFFTAAGVSDELIWWWLDWAGFFQTSLPTPNESSSRRSARLRMAAVAVRRARQALAAGGAVGIFLFEGDPTQLSLPTVRRLATPEVTVVPVGITMNQEMSRVNIHIGKGMAGIGGEIIDHLSERIDTLCAA